MKRTLLTCALALAALPATARLRAQPPSQQPAHTFTTEGDHFTLDGKPFKIISGELHYARIPREYWHARLKMAKAMGLNTIATYVFWNVHESVPGKYDFAGNNDLAAFIRAAQEEGLFVILRSGPYACAEWDLGGLPAWLLADPKSAQAIRTNDPAFMVPAERWITRLAQEVLPLQIARGGPILMTQIENEYGQFGDDHTYISHLHDIYVKLGFTDSLLYTADNWRHIPEGSIPGLFAATNFGINNHQHGMDNLAAARPGQALFVSEYWPGWFDHWGHPHETRPIAPQIEDIDYILNRGAGINIYMFHGGTSFGFFAGSSFINSKFLPDVTSYDYDAPLDESGRPTPKYFAYRKELAKFAGCPTSGTSDVGNESCLPSVPPSAPTITIPNISLTGEQGFLEDDLSPSIASALPAPMEHFGQDFGYILYRTHLPAPVDGDLVIKDLHDFAVVCISSCTKLVGTLDRRNAAPDGSIPPIHIATTEPAQLSILVANDGRVNVDRTMIGENKGITQFVAIAGRPLSNWQINLLPMDSPRTALADYSGKRRVNPVYTATESTLPDGRQMYEYHGPGRLPSPSFSPSAKGVPGFLRAHFTLTATGDTFLDTHNLGKGVVWINGHNLGRFSNTGPQQTLYVPGPWLKTGSNEIVVFDMLPTAHESVAGLDHPILNAPVGDKTTGNQE